MDNNSTTIQDPIAISVAIPQEDAVKKAGESIIEKIKGLLFFVTSAAGDGMTVSKSKFSSARMPRFNSKNILRVIVPLVIVGILVFAVLAATRKSPSVAGVATSTALNTNTEVKSTSINKTFTFPLKDANGKENGSFTYTIENAELRHQIVIKGQSATSVAGRQFLIINLKIVNSLKQGLEINSRDYLRISVDGNNGEWFAPDIHNDPVEAQAISTTNTRVGIALNDTDKNIKLQVGEIDGKKTIIPLTFK